MKVYRKRIADDILLRKLEGKGTVLIEEGALSLKTLSARSGANHNESLMKNVSTDLLPEYIGINLRIR